MELPGLVGGAFTRERLGRISEAARLYRVRNIVVSRDLGHSVPSSR